MPALIFGRKILSRARDGDASYRAPRRTQRSGVPMPVSFLVFFINRVQKLVKESGQFRGQSGHARASAEQKNICRFLVSGAAAAERNVDKSGQFFQEARRPRWCPFLGFLRHFQ